MKRGEEVEQLPFWGAPWGNPSPDRCKPRQTLMVKPGGEHGLPSPQGLSFPGVSVLPAGSCHRSAAGSPLPAPIRSALGKVKGFPGWNFLRGRCVAASPLTLNPDVP